MKRAFIEEATVTAWGMWMARHLEVETPTRKGRRILIFERLWDWDGEVSLQDAEDLAVAALKKMGRRPKDGGWFQDIIAADDRGVQLRHPVTAETWERLDSIQQTAVPHLYAVLELMPDFTGTWKD